MELIQINPIDLPLGVDLAMTLEVPTPEHECGWFQPRTSTVRVTRPGQPPVRGRFYNAPLHARQLPLLFGTLVGLEIMHCDPAAPPPSNNLRTRLSAELHKVGERPRKHVRDARVANHCASGVVGYLNALDNVLFHRGGVARTDEARRALFVLQFDLMDAHEKHAAGMWGLLREEHDARETMHSVLNAMDYIESGFDMDFLR